MRIWTERQIELRGYYEINLTSTALALLLSSGHPALTSIKVHSRVPSCALHVFQWWNIIRAARNNDTGLNSMDAKIQVRVCDAACMLALHWQPWLRGGWS
jgi:hypothetical protein